MNILEKKRKSIIKKCAIICYMFNVVFFGVAGSGCGRCGVGASVGDDDDDDDGGQGVG